MILFKMKAQSIGDSFSTQKFSIGASSAEINAEKLSDGNFGCFRTRKFWLLFSCIASKTYFEMQAIDEKDHVHPYDAFKSYLTGYVWK